VHRNIANTVHVGDVNAASVIEYAVAHLRVSTVVVCGHTQCGGVGAALGDGLLGGALDVWLGPVRGYVCQMTGDVGEVLLLSG